MCTHTIEQLLLSDVGYVDDTRPGSVNRSLDDDLIQWQRLQRATYQLKHMFMAVGLIVQDKTTLDGGFVRWPEGQRVIGDLHGLGYQRWWTVETAACSTAIILE